MDGCLVFLEKFDKLDYCKKIKVISNIFNINILIFNVEIIKNNFYIKFYDGFVYYQFCFNFNIDVENVKIEIGDRIVLCNLYIKNTNIDYIYEKKFYDFLKLLRNSDISLFDSFL